MRGDGDAVGFTFGSLRKFFVNKQLIPLAVLGAEKRIPAIPDVPTLAELGGAELNQVLGTYRVLAGPPNMPTEVTQFLRDALWKTLNDPEFVAWSKKAKRPVEPVDGDGTEKNMNMVMKEYANYKDVLRKYMK
jgi:tripartite-type tricarboxylate transporter receptor subunit TctC